MSSEVSRSQPDQDHPKRHPASSSEASGTLSSVLDVAHGLLAADAYALWLLDPEHRYWGIVQARGVSDSFCRETMEAAKVNLPPTIVCAEDVANYPFLASRAPLHEKEGIRSLLAVPLIIRESWEGTIVFYYRQRHQFSESEVKHASALATLTSSALEAAQLYEEQTASRVRSDFLSQASATLASSLDYERTLESVAQLAVPHIAEFCAVDMLIEGKLQRVAMAHADPATIQTVQEMRRRYPTRVSPDSGIGRVLATGEPQLYPKIHDEMLRRSAVDEEHLAMLRALGVRSALIVPLAVRDEVLGVLTLATAESERALTESDVTLAEEVAHRAAVAIDNARLFTALQKSEQKFRAVSTTASCAIFIHDGRTLLYANEAARKMGGFESEQLKALNMWQLVHPDDRALVQERVQARFRGEEVLGRHEFRLLRADGSVIWMDTSSSVIDFEGRPALLVTGFDVTEQKRLYDQLERREQEGRALLNSLPDVISRFDRELRYLYISPHVEKVSGIPATQFIGKKFDELGYPPELCALWTRSLHQLMETWQPVSIQFSVTDPGGNVRHFLGTGVPEVTREGIVESIVTISHDVTEQVNAANILRESRAQMRVIIDSMPALVAYVDCDECFVRVNRTFEQWFGAPLKNFLGKSIREVVGEQNYEHLHDHILQALRGEVVQYEATNIYHDAERRVLITYTPDFDDNQAVRGFVALVMDITESFKAQETLRKTEKLAATGRLAASIAHEINNPLESVMNLLFLLSCDAGLSDAGRQYLSMAEKELARVSLIATQTLRFHRQSSRPALVSVNEIIDAIGTLYERRFANAGVALQKKFRSSQRVYVLEGEIRQLLANLMGNALDATGAGGRVVVGTRSAIDNHGRPGLLITIADTGHGIPREMMPRIFEPFVTTKATTGTGLGLWVSKEIVEKHYGHIHVRSRFGGKKTGTVFRIFIADLALVGGSSEASAA